MLGAAADLGDGSVDALEAAIERHERHADAAVVEGFAEALLGLAQGGLRRLPLADVAHEGVEAPLAPLVKGGDGELDGHLGAVAAQALDLEPPRHHRHLIAREEARQPPEVGISVVAGDDRLMDGPPDDLIPAPAEEPLRLRVPLADQAVLVDRDEGLLGGLEDGPRLASGLSQGEDHEVDGEADGGGEPHRDRRPQELLAGVGERFSDHDGHGQSQRHGDDRHTQLAAGSEDGEPDDRQSNQRVEDARRALACVPQESDDDEVGEQRHRLSPGRKPGPGKLEDEDDQDRGQRGRDQYPRVRDRGGRERQQNEGQDRPQHERRCAPVDVHPLEEPPRFDVRGERTRPPPTGVLAGSGTDPAQSAPLSPPVLPPNCGPARPGGRLKVGVTRGPR